MNKHQKKTETTRRKLLSAARRIFARDGFEAARIESIAADAGYTRGAFYAQFKSKEDLFFALLEEQATAQVEELRKQLESCNTDEEKLATMRRYYVSKGTDKQWPLLVLEFKLYALRHPRLRAKLAGMFREIRTKLKLETLAAVLPSEFVCDDAVHHARGAALQAALHGLVLESAYDPTSIPEEEIPGLLSVIFDAVVGLDKAGRAVHADAGTAK